MARVLVVDDEVQLTYALRTALTREGYDVVVAHDGEQGAELAAVAAPDLVVLDLGLPDVDGVELTRRLRTWMKAPVLILSGATEERLRVQALDAGADDFLQKPFGIDELTARLRALARRTAPVEEVTGTHRFPGLEVDLVARTLRRRDEEVRLTPTEWRLLELFLTHRDRLLTHQWLLHRAWDSSHGDETREALRAHIRSLRAKIGDDASAPRFVRTESGAGYRWIAQPGDVDGVLEEPAGPEEPLENVNGQALSEMTDREIAHELNNALTALRMAVHLVKPRLGVELTDGAKKAVAAATARMDGLVARVTALVIELESRVTDL